MTKVTFKEVYDICSELLSGTEIKIDELTEESNIYQSVGANSIYLLMIALAIQDKYHVEIPSSLITAETKIKDIIEYIDKNAT